MKYHIGKRIRQARRWFMQPRNHKILLLIGVAGVIFMFAGFTAIRERMMMDLNYTELLNTIAEGESKGNYNAYFGNVNNTQINFTTMSVADVLRWQRDYVMQGHASSAVGKYQFIEPTLRGLVDELSVAPEAIFDASLQDRLAIHLIQRRGAYDYARGRISREQFAHNLSKEWAALPKVTGDNPGASYYDGDGLNKALVSISSTLSAIDSLHADRK